VIRVPSIHRLASALAVTAFVAGCATQSAASPTATPGSAATATPGASNPAATPAGTPGAITGGLTINVTQDATMGAYITGKDGLTLYLFTPDTATSSACTGGCADTWPALTLPAGQSPTAGAGVTGTFSTLTRTDGTIQVVFNGHPLYYFSGDSAAGQTNGQGLSGKWYIVSPSGDQITAAVIGY
jgi:predicted lipoprotein with Yx(FWY)xxD motif